MSNLYLSDLADLVTLRDYLDRVYNSGSMVKLSKSQSSALRLKISEIDSKIVLTAIEKPIFAKETLLSVSSSEDTEVVANKFINQTEHVVSQASANVEVAPPSVSAEGA